MAYFEENSEAMLALETMVDKVGSRNVLFALAHIARSKAAHVDENWSWHGDKAPRSLIAKALDADARTFEKTARLICFDPAIDGR